MSDPQIQPQAKKCRYQPLGVRKVTREGLRRHGWDADSNSYKDFDHKCRKRNPSSPDPEGALHTPDSAHAQPSAPAGQLRGWIRRRELFRSKKTMEGHAEDRGQAVTGQQPRRAACRLISGLRTSLADT